MIESVKLEANDGNVSDIGSTVINSKLEFGSLPDGGFHLTITFNSPIKHLRAHDYTWTDNRRDWIATEYSPKLLRLADETLVQANISAGIWEFNFRRPHVLIWHFNDVLSYPITKYLKPHNFKFISHASRCANFSTPPALLFSKQHGFEFSRSPVAFKSIICFTDHCDFDTLPSLILQREFFKKHGIKVTKGFFLNHFSKREDNPSFENDSEEYLKWLGDGHELAYHSLSQSIKKLPESIDDFESFVPPLKKIPTWIDHGFQPYNLSLFANFGTDEPTYGELLSNKGIRTLWNYVDSGTTARGVINQLNPHDFTLATFANAHRRVKFTAKAGLIIKNIIFHHYADETLIEYYMHTAGNFKKVIYKKDFRSIASTLKNFIKIAIPVLKVLFMWKTSSKKIYNLAKYTPTIFRHSIGSREFYVFQTVEMIDFRQSLHQENVDKLIRESGLVIAHTYFSVPMSYHVGRIFKSPNEIDADVNDNFKYLGAKIKSGDIWNPVLDELISFLSNFDKVVLDVNEKGDIHIVNASEIPYRTVS